MRGGIRRVTWYVALSYRAIRGAAVLRATWLFVALLPLCVAADSADPAGPRTCADSRLIVQGGDAADASLACEGGARAMAFLSRLGLRIPERLRIEVVPALPSVYGASALGSYDAAAGRIQVLAYERCATDGPDKLLFDQPLSHDLYRSLVAHEVAHAVVQANYSGDSPQVVPQEYIAYTTQFAAMSPELRAAILDSSRISAFAGEYQMSATLFFLDPPSFGIAAYRHFRNQPDGRPVVWRLLRGEAQLPHFTD